MRHIPPGPELELDDSTELPRRRHPRYADPGLSGHLTRTARARVVDLSITGIGLESYEPIAPRESVTVHLEDHDGQLDLQAESRWNRLTRLGHTEAGDSQAVYRLGLRFDSPQERDREGISRFLDRWAEGADRTRQPARFHLSTGNTARLETHSPFQVRTLSLSGMMVETERLENPGTRVDLLLDLPDGDLPLRARVVDSWHNSPVPKVRLAVAFDRIPAESRDRLDAFIEQRLTESCAN